MVVNPGHVVRFRANGRIAECLCGWRTAVADDLSDAARRRVIDAGEDHAYERAGSVELAGLGPVA